MKGTTKIFAKFCLEKGKRYKKKNIEKLNPRPKYSRIVFLIGQKIKERYKQLEIKKSSL